MTTQPTLPPPAVMDSDSDPMLPAAGDPQDGDAATRPAVTLHRWWWVLGGVLGVALVLGALWTSKNQPTRSRLITLERVAPAFDLPDPSGVRVRLRHFQGQVVLVNFWATWCIPCQEEARTLQASYERLRAEGFVIIGVNLRNQETNDGEVARFLDQYGITFPIALDTTGDVARDYAIYPIPVSYFVDPRGMIRYLRNGTLRSDEIEQTFRALQTERALP